MNMFSNSRKGTISSQFIRFKFKNPILKPKLIISGNWMKEAGFEIGDKVNITVNENQLIINKHKQ